MFEFTHTIRFRVKYTDANIQTHDSMNQPRIARFMDGNRYVRAVPARMHFSFIFRLRFSLCFRNFHPISSLWQKSVDESGNVCGSVVLILI